MMMTTGLDLMMAASKANYAYDDKRIPYIENPVSGVKLFTSTEFGTSFISVKGSDMDDNLADWRTNLNSEWGSLKYEQNGRLLIGHAGFINAVESVRARTTMLVNRLIIEEPTHVTFVGHSSGGALAQIFYTIYRDILIEAGIKVSCISFASPRWLATGYDANDRIDFTDVLRVETVGDPVPRIPFSLCGYRHVGDQLLLTDGKRYLNPTLMRRVLRWPVLSIKVHQMESYIENIILSLR